MSARAASFGQRPAQPRRQSPETALQIAGVEMTKAVLLPPPAGPVWTAINPIPAKSKAAAGISKAMGLVAGWPDLIFLWESRLRCFEWKAGRGKESADQIVVFPWIEAQGGTVTVGRTLPDLYAFFVAHGMPVKRIRWLGDAPVVHL